MKFEPIEIKLSAMQTILLIEGLNYMIADTDRLEIDRIAAEKIWQKLVSELTERGIDINGD